MKAEDVRVEEVTTREGRTPPGVNEGVEGGGDAAPTLRRGEERTAERTGRTGGAERGRTGGDGEGTGGEEEGNNEEGEEGRPSPEAFEVF